MEKITNEKYKAFLQGQMIETIPRKEFIEKMDAAEFKTDGFKKAFRCCAILLWMTAARPNEILRLQAKDLIKSGERLKVRIKGSKGGYEDAIPLPMNDKLVQEVWDFTKDKFADLYLFWQLQSQSKMQGVNRVSSKKGPDGTLIRKSKHYDREYPHLSNKIYRHFVKWFGVPPYYLRHNRMSVAGENLTINELMMLKRSKTEASVRPYLHLTSKSGRRIAKELTK